MPNDKELKKKKRMSFPFLLKNHDLTATPEPIITNITEVEVAVKPIVPLLKLPEKMNAHEGQGQEHEHEHEHEHKHKHHKHKKHHLSEQHASIPFPPIPSDEPRPVLVPTPIINSILPPPLTMRAPVILPESPRPPTRFERAINWSKEKLNNGYEWSENYIPGFRLSMNKIVKPTANLIYSVHVLAMQNLKDYIFHPLYNKISALISSQSSQSSQSNLKINDDVIKAAIEPHRTLQFSKTAMASNDEHSKEDKQTMSPKMKAKV